MKPFLTARWENLVNITYAVPPESIVPFLPREVEPDIIAGKAFVSLVPFVFRDTRLHGIKIPGHAGFTEMNLRCYAKCKNVRGIVFLKELVSKFFVAAVANLFYHEKFEKTGLRESVSVVGEKISVHYEINCAGRKFFVDAASYQKPVMPVAGSVDAYFKNIEYGFAENRKGEPLFFRVEHPQWNVFPLNNINVQLDFGLLYGKQWEFLNELSPINAAFSKGSEVKMIPHRPLKEIFTVVEKESLQISRGKIFSRRGDSIFHNALP